MYKLSIFLKLCCESVASKIKKKMEEAIKMESNSRQQQFRLKNGRGNKGGK